MINQKRLNEIKKLIKEGEYKDLSDDFNCHGLTAYLFNLEDKLKWVQPYDLTEKLKSNTKKKPLKGIERRPGELLGIALEDNHYSHSAVYIGEGQYIQKRGSGPLEITNYPEIRKLYFGQTITRYII